MLFSTVCFQMCLFLDVLGTILTIIIGKLSRKMFDLKTANHNSLFSQFDHIVTGCDSRIKQVGDDDVDSDAEDDDDDTHG